MFENVTQRDCDKVMKIVSWHGLQMTAAEERRLRAYVGDRCPYCLRDVESRYGNRRRHIRACGRNLDRHEKEMIFACHLEKEKENEEE